MSTLKYYGEISRQANITYFINKLRPHLSDDHINIYFKNLKNVLPTACVPIAGIIDSLRSQGRDIICHYPQKSYLATIQFNTPYKVDEHLDSLSFPFAKLWKFNNFGEVTKLVDAYLDELTSLVPCSSGLIEGLEWSLNETMDNVLQHSMCNEGYMMGVVHKSNNCVMFSIFDNGLGIYNSLRESEYHPRNAIDAISIALQEGKTRDHKIGQGNGLWGLNNIILKNKGRLEIRSHGSMLRLNKNGDVNKFDNLPCINKQMGTTAISFSLDYNNQISIADALGGYVPFDVNFDDKIDDRNCLKFKLNEETTGFGTRIAGERVRNKVLNYFKRVNAPSKIEIDFSGVSMISSSFADEFIGKMLAEFGFYRFTKLIVLTGISDTVESILNRSVSQRMAVIYSIQC